MLLLQPLKHTWKKNSVNYLPLRTKQEQQLTPLCHPALARRYGVDACAEVVGSDEDVVGAGQSGSNRAPPAHEFDGVDE